MIQMLQDRAERRARVGLGRGKQRTKGRPILALEQQEQHTNCLELSAAVFTLKSFLSSCRRLSQQLEDR